MKGIFKLSNKETGKVFFIDASLIEIAIFDALHENFNASDYDHKEVADFSGVQSAEFIPYGKD